MKNASSKPGKEKIQKRKDNDLDENAPEDNPVKESVRKVKVSREHDFSHTHPSHAHHKQFGLDHEPGSV